jgi:hypothetical protein
MIPFLQAILGDMISLVVIGAVIAGIMKLFQIATSLNEIKDLLGDIKRNTLDIAPSADYAPADAAFQPHSPDSLLRAVSAPSDPDAVPSTVFDPER